MGPTIIHTDKTVCNPVGSDTEKTSRSNPIVEKSNFYMHYIFLMLSHTFIRIISSKVSLLPLCLILTVRWDYEGIPLNAL